MNSIRMIASLVALLFVMAPTPTPAKTPARGSAATPAAPAPAPPAAPRALAEPVADSLLSQADAVAWLGGPLEDTFQQEGEPSSDNGHDHMTVRGWYPKGWNPQTAEAPPQRAIQAVVHAFADTSGAKRFYEFVRDRDEGAVGRGDGPFAGFAFAPIEALADECHAKHGALPGEDGAKISLATLSFRSGRTFVQMQVWMADGSALERATRAAREMDAKLR